jgi:glycosyltransferase involved in cell wall biosynthesis
VKTPPSGDSACVVIPVHNRAAYVVEAIQSAVGQGAVVGEIIVVDDGSTDDTTSVLAKFTEPRLRVIAQANRGPSAARNAGWRASRAPWVFFLDADDALPPGALDALLSEAQGHDGTVIPYGYEEVCGAGLSGPPHFTADLSQRNGSLLADIAINYRGTILCALFPRECLEAVGGFDERILCGEDYDFALRVARRFEFVHVAAPTYRARMHGENRHRLFTAQQRRQYLDTVEGVFVGETSLANRVLRRRALAHWHWIFGKTFQQIGDRTQARQAFAESLRCWPLKLDAWRQWLAA